MSQALKIIGISVIIMVVLFAIAAYGLMSKFKQDVSGIKEMQDERNAEVARIGELPELRGVLAANELLEAPFSHVKVAACLLVQGRLKEMSGPAGGRSTGPGDGPRFDYEDDLVVLRSADLTISIDGTTYPFTLDSLILSWPKGSNGMAGSTFESASVLNLLDPRYEEAERRVRELKGSSGLIDRYLRKEGRAGDPEVKLEEVLFSIGDTISFRGRIEGDRIVPLF